MPDAESAHHAPEDAEKQGQPERRAGAPSYDTSKENYAGIASGDREAQAAKDFAEMIVDTVREGLLVLDLDLQVIAANESFYDTFSVRPKETLGRKVYELGGRQWDLPELHDLLEDILPEKKAMDDYEVEHEFEGIGQRVMLLNARQLDAHQLVLLAIEDVTERRESERERHLFEEKVRESEERFRALVTAGSYIVYRMSPDWSEMRELNGRGFLPDTDAPSTSWWDAYIPPDDQPQVRAAVEEAIRSKSMFELEHRVRRADGTFGWTLSRAVPILDDEGAITEWFGAASDVTARKEAEAALRRSEERYRTLFETIDEGFCIVEVLFEGDEPVDYRFLETNPAFERQTGLTGAEGRRMRELEPRHEEHWFETYGRIARTGKPERFVNKAKHLEDRWYDVYAFPVEGDGRVAILFNDISEQKRAKEALRTFNMALEARVEERTRQVRELASTLTMAEQQERRRISQILHDDLQQQLYGIGMKMSFIRREIEAGDPEEALAHVGEAEAWLAQGVDVTRSLTVDLSPPILKTEGLTDTIRWLQSQMKELHDLEVRLEAEKAFRTPEEDMRVLIFQIVRELLFNVAKHAGVKQATVELRDVKDHVEIVVSDEGAGFDVEAAEARRAQGGGFGLFSAGERLGLFGGEMHIDSSPGEGTRVTLSAPLQLE